MDEEFEEASVTQFYGDDATGAYFAPDEAHNYFYSNASKIDLGIYIPSTYTKGIENTLTATIGEDYGTCELTEVSDGYYTGTVIPTKTLPADGAMVYIKNGTTQLGISMILFLQPDTFYEVSQNVTRESETELNLKFYSPNIMIDANAYGASWSGDTVEAIWNEAKLEVQVFDPNGEKLSTSIKSYAIKDNTFNMGIELPSDAGSYEGLYVKVLSDGKVGTMAGAANGASIYTWAKEHSDLHYGNYSSVEGDTLGAYYEFETTTLKSVKIKETAPEISVGSKVQLSYTKDPFNGKVNSVSWKSDNTKIATVDEKTGEVTGVADGSAKITLTVNGKQKDTVTVTVKKVPIESITLNKETLSLGIGGKETLTMTLTPENAGETLTWTSTAPTVAAVDASGTVTGISVGTATIRVSGESEVFAECEVTVTATLESVKLSKTTLSLTTGQTATLTATSAPAGVEAALFWQSANETVATVDQTGKVTAIGKGTAEITVTATDQSDSSIVRTANATVKVTTSDLSNTTASDNDTAKIVEKLEAVEDEEKQLWIDGLAASYVATGYAVEPNVSVYYGTTRLHLGTDYKISFKNNKAVSTDAKPASLTITGKGSFSGSLTQTFKIVAATVSTNDVSLKKAKIDKIANQSYTGSAITPTPVVKLNGETVAPENYEVSYSKNVDAGTATVVVTGKNGYKDSAKQTFKITAIDLSKAGSALDVQVSDAEYQAGGAIPEVTLIYTANGTSWTLRQGVDYKLGYANHKAISTAGKKAKVTITGIGDFSKKITREYSVVAGDMEDLTMSVTDLAYNKKGKNGTAYQSKVKIYGADAKTLKVNKDYTLTYTDLTAGNVTLDKNTDKTKIQDGDLIMVTAKAGSNKTFDGELTGFYTLRTVNDLSKAKATVASVAYDGTEKTPVPALTFGKAKTALKEGTDFEIVSYTNNVNKGTATILLEGTGIYSGTKTVTFKITAANAKTSYLGFWNGEEFSTK